MSTRARIGIKNQDNTITSVYCHNDGYIEHVGNILKTNYYTENNIREIMQLGDLSALYENINPTMKHDFEQPQKNVCVFYGRDRGDKNTKAETHNDLKTYLEQADQGNAEFVYLFQNEQWFVSKNMKTLKKL